MEIALKYPHGPALEIITFKKKVTPDVFRNSVVSCILNRNILRETS